MSSPIEYDVKVWPDGKREWYLNGKPHREGGPAVEWANGSKEWYLNGNLHREGGPAAEWPDGTKGWYLNGELFSHSQWKQEVAKLNSLSCNGKVVEIEGKKYKLMECE